MNPSRRDSKLGVAKTRGAIDIVRVPKSASSLSLRRLRIGLTALVVAGALHAAETRPVVGVGATRDAVLDAYGWPSGQSQAGEREIFTYPQGQVVLKNGVVERMEFSTHVEWPKPKPRPGALTTLKDKPAPVVPVVVDPWLADFSDASREARARPAHILVLFTGSDWSPPCQRFQAEVATNPAFVATIGSEFVLLRLDFPTHAKQPADVRLQNATLRERYNVTTYPTLLLLTPEGLELSRVDLAKPRPEPSYVEQVIAAVLEAKPKGAKLVSWAADDAKTPAGAGGDGTPAAEGRWAGLLKVLRVADDYRWAVGGGLVVVVGCWLLLRRRRVVEAEPEAPKVKTTMPTPADIAAWTQDRVRDVVAALFEFEGSRVELRSTESGAELALMHPNETRPRVLVRCQSAAAGLAGGKAVRNLYGTVVAEHVDNAWYVSPGGFTPEARQFARENGMVLIGGEDLLLRLKTVPPLALIRILAPKTE